jgi:hypothetical protein
VTFDIELKTKAGKPGTFHEVIDQGRLIGKPFPQVCCAEFLREIRPCLKCPFDFGLRGRPVPELRLGYGR